MDDVFLKLVNLSISASWLILAVLVLRVVLKKAPKWVMPLLWGVVALRLVCLFSIESALSLIPSAETIPSEIVTETREPVLYEQATLDIVTNPKKARVLGRRRGGARGRARGRVLFDESEVGARQPCLGAEAECGGRCVNRALRSGGRGGAAV